jgi:hypothetical protein
MFVYVCTYIWVISVYFNIRNTLPKFFTFLPGHPVYTHRDPDNSLARPTSHSILFVGKNISFDASLVIYIYIYSTNIPQIMIINRIYEHQNLLSL